jgi:predicted transcriptional regulator of viral defense system
MGEGITRTKPTKQGAKVETYKVQEGKLDKYQLHSLQLAVANLTNALNTIVDFATKNECGTSDDFCDKYPVNESLDEVAYKVSIWLMELRGKELDATQDEQDYYNGTTEVK